MRKKQDDGVYLVLVALLALVILSLCALAIGYGVVFSTNSRLISIANVSALGALDVYIRSDEPSESARRNAALAKANELLLKNEVPGLNPLNQLVLKNNFQNSADDAGYLSFGRYFSEQPLYGTAAAECLQGSPPHFPCFVESTLLEGANAVRIHLRTQTSNKLAAPFAKALGFTDQFSLSTDATAATVETCGVFLQKASLSSVVNTHRVSHSWNVNMGPEGLDFPYLTPSPTQDVAFHAFMVERLKKNGQWRDCFNDEDWLNDEGTQFIEEMKYWCSLMRPLVPFPQQPPAPEEWTTVRFHGGPSSPSRRHQSDFLPTTPIFVDYLGQEVIVDRYNVPFAEPLSHFLLGFNAGFRALDGSVSAADRTALMAFALNSDGRRWPLETAPNPMTNEMGMLVQLTNMENAGIVNEHGVLINSGRTPNYVTHGLLPVLNSADPNSTASNQVAAIADAINLISEQCPPASRKYIVLATDGLSTCLSQGYLDWLGPCDPPTGPGCPNWYCTRTGPATCEKSLCGNNYGYAIFYETSAFPLLLSQMQEAGIIFSVLFDGQGTRPHIKNVINEAAECTGDLSNYDNPGNLKDCFLSFSQGAVQGLGGMSNPILGQPCPSTSMFDCSSQSVTNPAHGEEALTHFEAYNDVVKALPGAYYGRSLAILGEMAARTGGLMCPLKELSPIVSDYIQFDPNYSSCPCLLPSETPSSSCAGAPPCKLRNSVRTPGTAQLHSVEYLRKGEQAAKCVLDTIGLNQTLFVHPWKEVFN